MIDKYPKSEPVLDDALKDSDKAFLVFTGGTTGQPKGAIWAHGALEKLYRGGGLTGFLELFQVMFKRLAELPSTLKKKLLKALLPAPLSWLRFLPISSRMGDWIVSLIATKDITKVETKQGWVSRTVQSRINTVFHAPMFHFKGWLISNLPLLSGSTIYMCESQTFNPREVLSIMENHPISILCTIGDKPVRDILSVLKKEKFDVKKIQKSLCFVLSGASKFSATNKKKWWEDFPETGIIDTVGASEAIILPKLYVPGDELASDIFTYQPEKMRIVDLLTNEDVKPGEQGECLYNIDTLPTMDGYFRDKKKTEKLFVDEKWLRSGDLYELCEDGENIRLIGRIKETIVSGGEKIHPPEVEDVLKTHPYVYDAIVIGIPLSCFSTILLISSIEVILPIPRIIFSSAPLIINPPEDLMLFSFKACTTS